MYWVSQVNKSLQLSAFFFSCRQYWDALKICMEQHVPMTEDLVEKLTPNPETGESDALERNRILEGISEVCMQQRQYHLATKKYTQAGNRVKVIMFLLLFFSPHL